MWLVQGRTSAAGAKQHRLIIELTSCRAVPLLASQVSRLRAVPAADRRARLRGEESQHAGHFDRQSSGEIFLHCIHGYVFASLVSSLCSLVFRLFCSLGLSSFSLSHLSVARLFLPNLPLLLSALDSPAALFAAKGSCAPPLCDTTALHSFFERADSILDESEEDSSGVWNQCG